MTALATDLLQEVGLPGTATTLSSPGYTDGDTSISVGNTANMPTSTGFTFAMDRAEIVDGKQVRIDGTYCEFVGIVSSSSAISSVSRVYGTAQDYVAGPQTRVYIPITSERENRIVEWGLVHANQDGTIKDGVVGALQLATAAVEEPKIKGNAVTFAKLAADIFGGQLQSYTPTIDLYGGITTHDETGYYLNLGGLKIAFGLIPYNYNNSTDGHAGFSLPPDFFNSIYLYIPAIAAEGNAAFQKVSGDAGTATTRRFYLSDGLAVAGGTVSWLVIGI